MFIVNRMVSIALVSLLGVNAFFSCCVQSDREYKKDDNFTENSLYQEIVDTCYQCDAEFDVKAVVEDIYEIYDEYCEYYPDKTEIIDEVVSLHLTDDNFIYSVVFDTENALMCLENSLYMATADDTASTYASYTCGYFSTNHYIPTVTQIDDYYCGPAATVQALIGNGDISATDYPNGYDSLQEYLGKSMKITKSNGTKVTNLTKVLNEYSEYDYTWQLYSKYSYSKCISQIASSLMDGKAPIIYLADTSALGYYSSTQQTHYVTVTMLDAVHEQLLIVDPHYDSAYNGQHTITYDELYEAMKRTSANGKYNSYIIG